ncbi:MAG TPA: hypothetical protein VGQ83_35825 [Polyangia bacterium]
MRDEAPADDPDLEVVARLAAKVPPLRPSPSSQQAVWSALTRAPRARPWHRRVPALAAGILLIATAAAAAGVAGTRLARRLEARRPAPGVPDDAGRGQVRAPGDANAAPAPSSQPRPAAPSQSLAGGAPVAGAARAEPVRYPRTPAPASRSARPPSPAAPTPPALLPGAAPDAELVLGALAALRREHAPARASALLEQYLHRHPDGLLAEDALALAIEAAAARGDAAAARVARRYLGQFPDGRFRATAQQAIMRFSSDGGAE